MGQHLMKRPPKFVQGFTDRHGKPRFYFRRPGFKNVPLPGLPWSPDFMAAYEAALTGQPRQIGSGRVKPGTFRALAVSYFNSPVSSNANKKALPFPSLNPSTQAIYRNTIERLCKEIDREGRKYGDKSAATMQREHVVKLMTAKANKPESANLLRKVLRAMMTHAVDIGLRADDPTRDVKAIRVKNDGFHSWTDAEIAQFEKHHAIGSRPRLAFSLLLYTGQRRSDVARMGRQHIDQHGAIHVRQMKTGAELAIPIHDTLAAIIAETPTDHLTFLTTQFGKPFTAAGFGNWFREQCNAAGLPHCSAHGLRKAAARLLAEAGCTAHEIASITGHASLREIARYTKAADQARLAVTAMDKRRTPTVKPDAGFDKKRKNK
jgi:integrase